MQKSRNFSGAGVTSVLESIVTNCVERKKFGARKFPASGSYKEMSFLRTNRSYSEKKIRVSRKTSILRPFDNL